MVVKKPSGVKRIRAYQHAILIECARLVKEDGQTGAQARAHILREHGESIPKGTLANYIHGRKQPDGGVLLYDTNTSAKLGAPTYLSRDDEQALYNLVVESGTLGCHIGKNEIASTAMKKMLAGFPI